MALIRQTWLLTRNDLRQELRQFELIATAGFFSLVVLVMFGLSFSTLDARVQIRAVPGMLWLSLAFVGALTLTRVFDRERESSTLSALLAAPVDRLAIYFSKLAITLAVLLACAAMLVPGFALMFPRSGISEAPLLGLATMVLLGCLGYAAIGTLFAAGLATSTGKNVLLSVVLYPLTTPVLLFALVATTRLLEGHAESWSALVQFAALDVILIGVAAWLFESVLVGAAHPAEPHAKATP